MKNLENKAITIFNFFVERTDGLISLYFDKDFNDYYVLIQNHIYEREEFKKIINEYMLNFDVSNIGVLPQNLILQIDDLILIKEYDPVPLKEYTRVENKMISTYTDNQTRSSHKSIDVS